MITGKRFYIVRENLKGQTPFSPFWFGGGR
jgi:hypothetical protein